MAYVTTSAETLFGNIVNRAAGDLGSLSLLEGAPDEWLTPAAGVPLYLSLWGRDALTATWQCATFDHGEMAAAALARTGRLQGTRLDPARDEEPGRIIQQARSGPLDRIGRLRSPGTMPIRPARSITFLHSSMHSPLLATVRYSTATGTPRAASWIGLGLTLT